MNTHPVSELDMQNQQNQEGRSSEGSDFYRIQTQGPRRVRTFVASFLEPTIAVLSMLVIWTIFEHPIERPTIALCVMIVLLCFPGKNRFDDSPFTALIDTFTRWIRTCLILLACGWVTHSFHFFDRNLLLIWAFLTPVIIYLSIQLGRQALLRYISSPSMVRPSLIVGANTHGVRLAEALVRHHREGVRFVGYVEDRDLTRCPPEAVSHVLGGFSDLHELVKANDIKDVYITLPLSMQPRIGRLLADLQDCAVSIHYVPDIFGISIIQGRIRSIDGIPVVSLLDSPFKGVNGMVKRISDIVLSTLILIGISPILLGVAIAVKLSSPGPVIFRQRRHGLDGQEIIVYKFRSMSTQDNGPVVQQATRNDPRITRVGAILRKTSLDELPQFINVLQGRMSIVGPRPHAVAHNEHYRKLIPAYMVRHKVRPGITGWAQVNGLRGETDTIDKMEQRVDYDLEYLRNWSLTLDLKIIARTIALTVFDRNAY